MSMVPLRRVAHVVAGQSPPSDAVKTLSSGLPFIQGNAEFTADGPKPRLECDDAPKRAAKGDLLLSVRAPVGAMNWCTQGLGIGRGVAALRPSGDWDSRFLAYAIRAKISDLRSMAAGSTFDAVTSDTVGDLPLPMADVEEQRRIADFLDDRVTRIDQIIAARQRQRAATVDALDALIRRLTTTASARVRSTGISWMPSIASDWSLPRVANVFRTGSGSTPPSHDHSYYDGGVPWVNTGDVRDCPIGITSRSLTDKAALRT